MSRKTSNLPQREGPVDPLADLLGESPGILAVREKITRLLQRQSDSRRLPPILIRGETGTGKGLLARAIHQAGPRASGPFITVNCAAIPETLLEAELFGFERGAFTDARQAKAGLFQTAHHGTIFLDEVGLLPEGLQGKLLTAIEERQVRRLGSTRSEPVDAWVMAATSADLEVETRARRFREDLYHRLAVLTLELPPLRERGEDILLLAEHFLARACADYSLPPKTLAPDAQAALLAYPWPGNIRELSNVLERVALLQEARVVTAAMLGLPEAALAASAGVEPVEEFGSLKDTVASVERERLLTVLQQTNWNISRAALRLGVPRNTLRYRIEKHGLSPGGAAPRPRRKVGRPQAPVPVAPAAPALEAPAPAGVRWEQRRLTLLRAVLVSPQGATASVDMSQQLEALLEKAESFGGRLQELSPAGVVAAFGLEPVEDAPMRAGLAALAIQKAVERTRRGDANGIAVKIGIHTGQFEVGRVSGIAVIALEARRDAWPVLEELVERAQPDSVLVSEAAVPFLERRFDLFPMGDLRQAPGRVYRLAGRERPELGLGGRMARFVGRRHEFEALRSRLASAMLGQGQVVGIVGEAGLGKSRLLFEFRQSLGGEPVKYLEGRCFSYGSAIPYLPVLEIVRSACGLVDTDTPELMAEKVRRHLGELGMAAAEVAPYLLQLLGVKEGTGRLDELSPEAIQFRTFEILRQMSLNASQRRPLVLAIENLHWIDATSESYLASLVESLVGFPILLLLTHRSGYRPPWMEKSYATQIALGPLSPEDSLSVVQSVPQAEQIPDALSQLIVAKAEGNPFFLEELARAVVAHGDLSQTLVVPDTIQEVLLARINRLADEPKRLLQTASVLGREVSLRLLGAIWEGPGDFEPHLSELKRLEFLYERIRGDEPTYVFRHALTQEVAYESLPLPHRRALHAAAGRALEALYADRLEDAYDRLVHHYSKTEEAAKAVEYLARFAEKVARAYAHEEAVRALQEAVRHVERLPAGERDRRVLDLILRLAHSLSFLGRFQESLDLLLREQERLVRLQDATVRGQYYFWLGHTYSYLGDHERAVQNAERAIEEARRSQDQATMGKAHVVLAQESYWSGQPLLGIDHGQQAAELLERAGERWWQGLAHWIVGINYVVTGEFERALEAESRARAVGEAIGDPRLQSYAAWSAGWVHALMGDWEAGIEACRRGLGRSLDPVNTAVVLGHMGYAYLAKGDPAEAISLLEQSVQEMRRFRFKRLQGRFLTFLGEAYLMGGQLEKARELVSLGLEITRDADYRYGVGWALLALGRIAQAGGALPEAEGYLTKALEILASVQARFMEARTRLALAELAHAQRNAQAAARHLSEAHRLFTALGVPRYAEETARRAGEMGVSF